MQNEESFYERLEILLTLARWTGPPPTIKALARQLGKPPDTLSYTLSQLRLAHWLVSGENQLLYTLTPEGRILIVLLQLLAQPWTDSDTVPIAAKLSGVAESLGIQADFRRAQFDMLLAALEVQIGKIATVVGRLLTYRARRVAPARIGAQRQAGARGASDAAAGRGLAGRPRAGAADARPAQYAA